MMKTSSVHHHLYSMYRLMQQLSKLAQDRLIEPSRQITTRLLPETLSLQIHHQSLKGSAYSSLNPSDNTILITYAIYASAVGSNNSSATLLIADANFRLYNINMTNSAGTAGRAVAVSRTGANQGFLCKVDLMVFLKESKRKSHLDTGC
ncbi:hypothetical protein BJ878DRAFT_275621 [Calycina marina]|uniref:Uncharacterized protein n=1 Tax=Calycina marina TaxID=1763456 RepID=A0A9P8CB72_9HELO|nr:hypothetical protein BJ878DRAFT_275621 [Calycina marina]